MSNDFKTYLLTHGITSERYVQRRLNLLQNYLNYLEKRQLTIQETAYTHLLDFVGALQSEGKSVHHINSTLQVVSHYYEFCELPNLAQTVRVK